MIDGISYYPDYRTNRDTFLSITKQDGDIKSWRQFKKLSLKDLYNTMFYSTVPVPIGLSKDDYEIAHSNSAQELLGSFLFEAIGRPTWKIEPDLVEFLQHVKCDVPINQIILPKDVLCFNFPKGFRINNIPCRNVLFFNPRSKISRKIIHNTFNVADNDMSAEVMCVYCDCGELTSGGYTEDGISGLRTWARFKLSDKLLSTGLEAALRTSVINMSDKDISFIKTASQICAACILYVRAKPDMLQERRHGYLPRLKKEKQKQIIGVVKPIRTLPSMGGGGNVGDGTRSSPRPHLRGWVLRVLRHERYKRDELGRCRTILVQPTVIGANSVEELGPQQDISRIKKRGS